MSFDPKWELLRSLGDSKFAKLSVFVPLFGYLIIFNDAFVSFIGSSMKWACFAFQSEACSEGGVSNLDDKFMLRKVVNIYIALSAIGLSTAIFQMLCPHEIRKYLHAENYVSENTVRFHPELNLKLRAELDKNSSLDVKRVQDTFDHYKEFDRPKASEMYDRDILSLWFDLQNGRFTAARWTCFILYCFGVVLLSYPAIIVFLKVLSIIV